MILITAERDLVDVRGKLTVISCTTDEPLEPVFPFNGFMTELREKYFTDSRSPNEFYNFVDYLKEDVPDFQLSKYQKSNLEKLEDVTREMLFAYVGNCVYSYRYRTNEGKQAYDRYHTRLIRDVSSDAASEDSDFSMGDYIFEQNDGINRATLIRYKKELPYLLVRMHEKSKLCGVSVFSIARALSMELDKSFHVSVSTNTNLINRGIYRMNSDGTIGKRYNSATGMFQNEIQYWLRGQHEYRDVYYTAMCEFLDICRKLNIDLAPENPELYDESFMRRLLGEKIIPNQMLIATMHRLRKSYDGSPQALLIDNLFETVSPKDFLSNDMLDDEGTINPIVEVMQLYDQSRLPKIPDADAMFKKLFGASKLIDCAYKGSLQVDRDTLKPRYYSLMAVENIENFYVEPLLYTREGYLLFPAVTDRNQLLFLSINHVMMFKEYGSVLSITLDGRKELKCGDYQVLTL